MARMTPERLAEIDRDMVLWRQFAAIETPAMPMHTAVKAAIELRDELEVVNKQCDALAKELHRQTEYVKEMGDIP